MLPSTDYRELRSVKRYQTSDEGVMSHHGSTEEIANRRSSENVRGEIPEFQTLAQEAVNEQIRGFIAPPTRQLEELTRLVQGMSTSRHWNSYPRTELGTTSGTAMPQSDTPSYLASPFEPWRCVLSFDLNWPAELCRGIHGSSKKIDLIRPKCD